MASSEPVVKACPLGKNWWRGDDDDDDDDDDCSDDGEDDDDDDGDGGDETYTHTHTHRHTLMALMSDSCPVNVCLHMPSLMSHSWWGGKGGWRDGRKMDEEES